MSLPLSQLDPTILRLCRAFERAGHSIWLVGGAVRDRLLGMPGLDADYDFATTATPEEMQTHFPKVIPTGIEHGTVTIVFERKSFEVTTLRGEEGYSDGRRPDRIYFTSSLKEDLARRDFTINAIAYDPLKQEIHDPFAGQADLEAGLIRAVGEPLLRFSEDGLRVLRCARFAAKLNFAIEPATLAALFPSLASYRKVAKERILDEWQKTLKTKRPSRCFRLLAEHGILEATHPALGLKGELPSDTYFQKFDAMQMANAQLASLFRWTTQAEDLAALLEDLKFSLKDRAQITALYQATSRYFEEKLAEKKSEPRLRAWLAECRRENLNAALLCIEADYLLQADELPPSWEEERAALLAQATTPAALSRNELQISGKELIAAGIPKGKQIGDLLEALMRATWEDPALNQPAALLALTENLLAQAARND